MVLDYVPSLAGRIIGFIISISLSIIIIYQMFTNPAGFWKWFKYIFWFLIIMDINEFLRKFDKDK